MCLQIPCKYFYLQGIRFLDIIRDNMQVFDFQRLEV